MYIVIVTNFVAFVRELEKVDEIRWKLLRGVPASISFHYVAGVRRRLLPRLWLHWRRARTLRGAVRSRRRRRVVVVVVVE